MLKPIALCIYALAIFAGGLIGFLKSQSVASVVMGSSFAALLLGCAWAMFYHNRKAFIGAVALTGILFAFFTIRYFDKQTFMPPGMIALMSLGMLAVLLWPGRSRAAL